MHVGSFVRDEDLVDTFDDVLSKEVVGESTYRVPASPLTAADRDSVFVQNQYVPALDGVRSVLRWFFTEQEVNVSFECRMEPKDLLEEERLPISGSKVHLR